MMFELKFSSDQPPKALRVGSSDNGITIVMNYHGNSVSIASDSDGVHHMPLGEFLVRLGLAPSVAQDESIQTRLDKLLSDSIRAVSDTGHEGLTQAVNDETLAR